MRTEAAVYASVDPTPSWPLRRPHDHVGVADGEANRVLLRGHFRVSPHHVLPGRLEYANRLASSIVDFE
jgi:hypothetical protein